MSDSSILKERFLEDINNIINNGEVPSLMQSEDMEEVYNDIRLVAKQKGIFESKENMNHLFRKMI